MEVAVGTRGGGWAKGGLRRSDRLDAIIADKRDGREYITTASVLALDPVMAVALVSSDGLCHFHGASLPVTLSFKTFGFVSHHDGTKRRPSFPLVLMSRGVQGPPVGAFALSRGN